MGRTINYHGGQKIYDTDQIDEKLATKQDLMTIDTALSSLSTNPVQNKAIAVAVSNLESLERGLEKDLSDEVLERKAADKDLQDQIDAISSAEEKDKVPVKDSTKAVESNGIFDAIRFASVKIGETMFWPAYDPEEREVVSDDVLTFTGDDGKQYSYTIPEDQRKVKVSLCVAKDVPDGWHALDGRADLSAEDYPELAAFFRGDNTTTDKKIWLPYVQQKIIKVAY